MTDPPRAEQFKPLIGNEFLFRCYKGVPCFTKCCARLRLILTPYDILRMKNRLGLSSDEFLESYTDTAVEDQHRFPMVKLKMRQDQRQSCPFVTPKGCTIYEDRPGACRLYPLGRASAMVDGHRYAREKFFVVAETHCKGFEARKRWTLNEWLKTEGVNEYNAINDQWLKILTSSKSLGRHNTVQKYQMFFMASYNLDKFRKFLFESRFFDLFEVDSDSRKELENHDVALMKFGFEWLRFSLFGDKTIQPRKNAGKPQDLALG